MTKRGFFGIGVENVKTEANIGTLWRSAMVLGAAFIFTIHRRYSLQRGDTTKSWRHIPLLHYDTLESFVAGMPHDSSLIGIEQDEQAQDLSRFVHPARAVYVLGAEDRGLSKEMQRLCSRLVAISAPLCLNVAVAGSIVMWHRQCAER